MDYIIRYTGNDEPGNIEALTEFLNHAKVQILDKSNSPKMLVVGNVSNSLLDTLKSRFSGNWLFIPYEKPYKIPSTRRTTKKR